MIEKSENWDYTARLCAVTGTGSLSKGRMPGPAEILHVIYAGGCGEAFWLETDEKTHEAITHFDATGYRQYDATK